MTFLCACSNDNNDTVDEFKIEIVGITPPHSSEIDFKTTHSILFRFLYTEEMFNYEIRNSSAGLLFYLSINGGEEKPLQNGNVNLMYGIPYGNGSRILAFKPNEYVYFYMALEPNHYEINFKLYYADYSPYKLLETCKVVFDIE